MDWRFKTGIMKRKLNEKASDTDKEKVQRRDGSAALGIILPRSCIQTALTIVWRQVWVGGLLFREYTI